MILAPPLRNPAYLFSNPKSHWRLDQNYLRGMGYYCIFDSTAASNNYNRDHVVGKIEKNSLHSRPLQETGDQPIG